MLNIELDNEGFLVSSNQWDPSVANDLASLEGIKLNDEHWEIIDLLQEFYEKTDTVPEMRPLANLISKKLGKEKSKSIHLMLLFGGSPAKTAAKISGLPKPSNCI